MKTLHRVMAIGLTAALSTVAFGGLAAGSHESGEDDSLERYRAKELSLDLFGTGSISQSTVNNLGSVTTEDVRLGAGTGVNYFFHRNIGVGGEAYTENTDHSFVDSASLNLIGRFPIGHGGLAPYVFGGGGYQFDVVEQWLGNAGAGLEYRFTRNWGVFIEARYVFADETKDYGLGRLGVRLSF